MSNDLANERPLERPRFFDGRLLSADDLRREQEYFIERLRRRNRLLHGWGVVTGLRVSVDRPTQSVVVAPGFAIDCVGDEIVVACEVRLALDAFDGYRYVTVAYGEVGIDPVPGGAGTEASRIREEPLVALADANPNAGHRGIRPGAPGCGHAHPLCIATLSRRGARWIVLSASHGA